MQKAPPCFLWTMHEKKLETRDLKELALSPNWGPPPIWADFLEEYQHVNFGEHFKAHLERIKLPNFLYSDEEEDL